MSDVPSTKAMLEATPALPVPLKTTTAAEAAAARKGNYLEWIDILRGLAALAVILYHSRVDLWVGFKEIRRTPELYSSLDRMLAWLSVPIAFGGGSVMLFFLVSGFCVHLPYANNARPLKASQYFLRRALRIVPPYWLAVALTFLIESIIFHLGGPAPTSAGQILRVATLSQNYGAHAEQMVANGALWTLPVECELYVIYLLFFYLFTTFSRPFTAAIVSGVSFIATMGYIYGWKNLDGNFARFWAIWCAGALLAEWFKRGKIPEFKTWHGILGFSFIAAGVFWELKLWPIGALPYLWAPGFFFLMWYVLANPQSLQRFPVWCVELMVVMGKISYSAYLIHLPFFALSSFIWRHFANQKPVSFLIPLLFSALVWPLAWVFWRVCEAPFHRLSQSVAKKRAV